MTNIAEVTRVYPNGICDVSVKRESACGGQCSSCGGCSGAAVIAKAVNSAGASVGDICEVESSRKFVLGAAALAYLLPAVTALIGGAAGEMLIPGDAGTAIGIISGLLIGLIPALIKGKKRTIQLTVSRIILPKG